MMFRARYTHVNVLHVRDVCMRHTIVNPSTASHHPHSRRWILSAVYPARARFGRFAALKYAILVALLTTLIGIIGIVLVYSAPPASNALHTALFPAGCDQPCAFGIQPGVTSRADAERVLRDHPWVDEITHVVAGNFELLRWTWNGSQPAALTPVDSIYMPFITLDAGLVRLIYLPTRIPFGDVWAWWGAPERGLAALSGRAAWLLPEGNWRAVDLAASYFDGALEVQTLLMCPVGRRGYWRAPTQWVFNAAGTIRPDLAPAPSRTGDQLC